MKIENVALRVRLVVFTISLLSFVLPAAADTTLTVEVDGSEKTLDAITSSYKSSKYWGVSKSDKSGIIKSVTTSQTSSSSTSTSTTIVLTGKTGTATVTVFRSSSKSPKSGTTVDTITITAVKPAVPEEVEVAVHDTKSFDFTWTADSNAQYWQVSVNRGSANATAKVDNPGDRNTSPQGSKVLSNKITITGVAVGTASFTVQNKSTSGNPWANFKTYNVTVTNPYTVIPTPVAETGFVYDGESHQGVKAGEHYTLGGTYTAVNAGTHAATATPKSGYCWEDGSTAAKTITWTIARRKVTVTVVSTNKIEGALFIDPDRQAYNDPIWTTTTEGLIASDTTELTWDIFRTNACEEVGTYDLLIEGEKKQGNYDLTFFGGRYEICEAPPPETEIAVPTAIAGLVFNGQPQKGVADGDGYTLVNNIATSAGKYTAVATLEDGYVWSDGSHEPKEIAWSIAKAVYDLSGVTFENTTVTYNGQERTITVSEGTLPQGVQAVCDGVGTNAGVYAVTVVFTGDDNYETMTNWTVQLTIGRAPAVVTAVSTNKFAGADDPTFTATETGLVDDFKLVYDVVRTNASEAVGFYDLVPQGEVEQGNYTVSYRKGTFEIKPIPTFTITITRGAGIADITNGTASVFSGAEKSAAVELEAGTKTVTLTLAADRMTIPIYKVITNDVTNVTTRVATYAIAEGCTLTFAAEEAKVDDPAVTDEQTTAAIIAAIDVTPGSDTHDKAVAKVETITAGEEGERAVAPKDLATWITDKKVSSTSISQSDYVAASVHLNTSAPITDKAEVEFTEIGEVSSDAFAFAFEVKLAGKETPEELNLVKEFIACCIETTGDLGGGFSETVDPRRVKIEDGKVVITPDPEKTAEFFKIVILRDPTR